jgi:hypothetical protein
MASKKSNLTGNEKWAQKELLAPFLEAMSDWKGQVGANPGATATASDMKPIPCNPGFTKLDVCLSPFPPPPPPPPHLGKKIPRAMWPKVEVRFKVGP